MPDNELKNLCPCAVCVLNEFVMSVCACGRERTAPYCESCGQTLQVGGHVGCRPLDYKALFLREVGSLTSVTLVSRTGCWKSPDPMFWSAMLQIAQDCGWTPASSNDQQEVLTSDAKAFVAALELALLKLPDCDQATFLAAKKVFDRTFKEQPAGFHAEPFAKGENVEGQVQQNPSETVTGSLSPAEIQEVKLEALPPISNNDALFKYFNEYFKRSIADLVGFVHEAVNEPFDDGRAFKIS